MPEIKWRDLTSRQNISQPLPPGWTEIQPCKNFYDLLEVSPAASFEVIKAAYRALMEKYHPDKHPAHGRTWAEEIARQLNQAYAILSSPQKRRDYDYANGIRTGT